MLYGQFLHSVGFICMRLPNEKNLFLGNTIIPTLFSLLVGSMLSAVFVILLTSTPVEVSKSIVLWISVKMPALHSFWARSEEGTKNETMDKEHRCPPVLMKISYLVSTVVGSQSQKSSGGNSSSFATACVSRNWNSSWQGLYTAPITDTVQSNKIGNVSPVFPLTVAVDLNTFIKFATARIADSHYRLPKRSPEEEWAGGREYRFSDRRPSPSYRMEQDLIGKELS